MIAWCELPAYVQGLTLTAMTLTLCFALWLMPGVLRQYKLLLCVTAAVCFLSVMMLGCCTKASDSQSEFVRWWRDLPFWAPMLLLVTTNAYLAGLLIGKLQHCKHTIAAPSVKESTDPLPTSVLAPKDSGKCSNAERAVRERVQLDTKACIHSQFGQALLATRHYLRDAGGADVDVMRIWTRTIEALRNVSILPTGNDPLQTLQDAARSAGLKLEIQGGLPEEEPAKTLLTEAATEALTNAVRHAEASTLYFEIFETRDMAVARFANDGKIPDKPLVEGGGLGVLRRKTELAGGSMTIETTPNFMLVLKIPKKRSDDL